MARVKKTTKPIVEGVISEIVGKENVHDEYNEFENGIWYEGEKLQNEMLDDNLEGGESQNIYLSMLKDQNTELGYVCKSFVKCGLSLGMKRQVSTHIINLLDMVATNLRWEMNKWNGIRTVVTELVEEISEENEESTTSHQQSRDFSEQKKESAAHDLAQLIYIMEKDLNAELGAEDAALLEKNMEKWREQIQMMRDKLKTMA